MLPNVAPIIVSWLTSATAAAVGGRVATIEDTAGTYPQIVVVGTGGAPDTTAQGLSPAGTYPVTLWAVAGRRSTHDDLPDDATAWAAAQSIVAACEVVHTTNYVHSDGARITAAEPVSVVPSTATPRGTARVVVTLQVRIRS